MQNNLIMFVMQDVDYFPPMGIMQISAIAKREGYETTLSVISREDTLKRIRNENPLLVCYGGSTGEHKYYTKFNKIVKECTSALTVIGGVHATFFPEVQKEGEFDFLFQGEAEIAFSKFLNDGPDDKTVFRADELVADLDTLPFPDRDLFYQSKIAAETGKTGTKHFRATRGCPYDCTYCFNHGLKEMYKGQKYVRRYSVDYIISEIQETRAKYNLNVVKFYDDIFTYRADDWLVEFNKKYKKEIGLPFFTMTRFDLITEEMVFLLADSGCRVLQCSIESINDRIRNDILKRNMSVKQMQSAMDLCDKYGIRVIKNCMIGLPTSTLQDEIDAINFASRQPDTFVDFPIYQPYPKTPLGEYCRESGLYDGRYDDMHLSYGHHSVLNCFDKKYNNILRNLAMLGTVACRYRALRWLIVNVLIYMPNNRMFFVMFYLTKMRYHFKHVYNYKHGFIEFLRLIKKSIVVEFSKRKDNE